MGQKKREWIKERDEDMRWEGRGYLVPVGAVGGRVVDGAVDTAGHFGTALGRKKREIEKTEMTKRRGRERRESEERERGT